MVRTFCLDLLYCTHSLCIDASVSFTQAVLDKIAGECELQYVVMCVNIAFLISFIFVSFSFRSLSTESGIYVDGLGVQGGCAYYQGGMWSLNGCALTYFSSKLITLTWY